MNKNLKLQIYILFSIIIANFISQIPYFIHIYYKNLDSIIIHFQPILIMFLTFLFFIIPYILFLKGKLIGYWGLVIFLLTEFLFYFFESIMSGIHGLGFFFQLNNPDFLLRLIFAIGYLNLFASGYFLLLLILNKNILIKQILK